MRISPSPEIDDPELTLRPIELSDVEAMFGFLSQPRVIEHTSWNITSTEDLRALVEIYNSDDLNSAIQFAITQKSTNTLIGIIGFHTVSMINRTAEIAYTLHPDYWNRGIATTLCRSLVDWALTSGRFVRVQATALDTNHASARVLQKAGFELEGTLRNFRMVRGKSRDFLVYSIISN